MAAGALAVVVAAVAYIVFAGGGGATYKFELENDSQLVLGDQVQVGGVPVGSVTGIALTHNYRSALITIHIEGSLVPLHRGTTAQVRVPSLTTVAGRYVSLSPGPNNAPALPPGSTLPAGSGKGTTDLDQLFDTLNPRTRKGLQEYFVGEGRSVRRRQPGASARTSNTLAPSSPRPITSSPSSAKTSGRSPTSSCTPPRRSPRSPPTAKN